MKMKRINENIIEKCPFRRDCHGVIIIRIMSKSKYTYIDIGQEKQKKRKSRKFCHKLFIGCYININFKG